MKIRIPENVRLCGEGINTAAENITERVYLEDYVVTFLRQAKDGCREEALLIDLYGKKQEEDGKTWFFVYAAGLPSDAGRFTEYEWLGQAYWQRGKEPEEYIAQIQKKEDSLHAVLASTEGELIFFINENGYVRRADSYYVFYEKNEVMQSFLIEWYRRNLNHVENEHTDHAAKDFRRIYQERQTQQHQTKIISLMYAASLLLLILCCITGISMMNQYGKMKQMGESIDHLAIAMEERRLPERTYDTGTVAEPDNAQNKQSQSELADTDEPAIPAMGQGVSAVLPEPETGAHTEPQTEDVTEPELEAESEPADETEAAHADDKPAGETQYYIVKEGDTLAGISRTLYGTSTRLVDLCDLNEISNPNNIIVGQKILLPSE